MSLNDGKAGMQGLDKEKINKIIHEASKGSKFYENEKRKDERVQERVCEMKRDLAKFTETDKKKAIVESDKLLKELEDEFDFTRTICHVDMDAFYAAVEMRDDPKLKDVPMAVGGNDMLSTSNYLARKFGVRAAMPGFIAKKLCPNLVIVSSHFDKYRAVSAEIREIFKEYDPNFSPMSLDEAYLDLTEYLVTNCEELTLKVDENDTRCLAEIVVEEIRTRIHDKTQLTASAGIAPNLMLSKICSDFNKPNGQYYLQPNKEMVVNFIQDLPIRKVFGIGRVTEQMLQALGVTHVKDLLAQRDILYLLFSTTTFAYFMRVALGISGNRIMHDDRKSMSVERTFHNQQDKDQLLKICNSLCQELANDLKKESLQIRNITLKYKLSSFVTKTRSKSIPYSICKAEELFRFSKEILLHEIQEFQKEGKRFELRLMGVRGAHFYDKKQSSSLKQNVVEDFFTAKYSEISPVKQGGACAGPSTKADDKLVPCPVCGALQSNANLDALNSHIDACLTKQTIKEIVKEQDLIEAKTQKSSPAKSTVSSGKRKSNEQLKKKESKKSKNTLHSFWNK
uniref:DNA polymerase kappa n=2 Tax=Clytia hemisphaerica TaxID=252671 RepID=A0A7M5X7L2_9CNID